MYTYDLGHYSFQTGEIGHLQTLSVIPTLPGDRFGVDLTGIFRLSPLRRNLTVDARCDICCFWQPHRHIYGDDWNNFILQGVDESITFPGFTLPGTPTFSMHGWPIPGGTAVPLWVVAGYNRIWNRYWRQPTDDASLLADTYTPPTTRQKQNGLGVSFLPAPWNTGIEPDVDADDLNVSTAGDLLDLTALAQQKARLKTERRREWYGRRYTDILDDTYGVNVNIDADERPELCHRTSFWLSGYDVDGTGDANLGQYSGKGQVVGNMRMPRKLFTEHGALWIMCVMRFPSIHERELPYLYKKVDPTYKEIAGDPDIIANEPPETLDAGDYFQNSVSVVADAGIAPYGQHYRWMPNAVHRLYDAVNGFTFLRGNFTTKNSLWYMNGSLYDQVFQSTQLGHWQSQVRIDISADRVVPPVSASIFAGAKQS